MLTSTNKNRGLVNCVKNEIHPRAGKYAPVQPSRSWTELLILFLVTFVVSFGACFVLDRVLNGIDHPSSAVTTSNYVINEPATGVFEKHQLQRIVEGFYNGSMKNDDNIPVDVRDLIIGFIREPFDLKWRGTFLFAVHPHPIDFHRTGVWYEFVAKNKEGKEIRINHDGYTPESDWKLLDKPEMRFNRYRAGRKRGQDNSAADHWKSVTLKVAYLDEKRERVTWWPTTTVNVPNFHETLQEKLRVDLNLPELEIPKRYVVGKIGDVDYFRLRSYQIDMTRFYCDREGGRSYEVVHDQSDEDDLTSEEFYTDLSFSLYIKYRKVNGKWDDVQGLKFMKADPSSLV
eukprot:390490_1